MAIPGCCPCDPSAMRAPVIWCNRTCFGLKRKYQNVEQYHLRATHFVRCWAPRQSVLNRSSSDSRCWPSPLFIYGPVKRRKIHKIVRGGRGRQLSCKTRGTIAHERTTNWCRKSTGCTNKTKQTRNKQNNAKRVRRYIRFIKNGMTQSYAVRSGQLVTDAKRSRHST